MINAFNQVKICDLGIYKCYELSSAFQTNEVGVVRRTLPYLAPELVMNYEVPKLMSATKSSDSWALACTFWELYNKNQVWQLTRLFATEKLQSIFEARLTPSYYKKPSFLTRAMELLFNYDAENRLTMQELVDFYDEAVLIK